MLRKSKPRVPQAVFSLSVNGKDLRGEKRNGRWYWWCPAWPDLVKEHNGKHRTDEMVSAFMMRALANSIVIRAMVGE